MTAQRFLTAVALMASTVLATGCMTKNASLDNTQQCSSRAMNGLRAVSGDCSNPLPVPTWGTTTGTDSSTGTSTGTDSSTGTSTGTATGVASGTSNGLGVGLGGGLPSGIDPAAVLFSLLQKYGNLANVPGQVFSQIAQYFSELNAAGYGNPHESILVVSAGGAELESDPGQANGGGPHVKVYLLENQAGSVAPTEALSFFAYDQQFHGGVRSAVGDLDGDGLPEIVTVAGPGGGPHMKIFNAAGKEVLGWWAYDQAFRGGVFVAVGDIDKDGKAEIVTGAGPGGGPHVKVWKVTNTNGQLGATETASFMAFDQNFKGGVRVAVGDYNNDTYADIITGAGPGGGPRVDVFSGKDIGSKGPDASRLTAFFAYDQAFRGGVYVAATDADGDGYADVVTGPGAGGGPHLRVFSGQSGAVLVNRWAYDQSFVGGVRVGGGLGTDDAQYLDTVCFAGVGGGPHVRAFHGVSETVILNFMAFDQAFTGGIFGNFYAYW